MNINESNKDPKKLKTSLKIRASNKKDARIFNDLLRKRLQLDKEKEDGKL